MTVWQLSVRALPVILAIVMVRALALHRIPKRTFWVLWGLALFALLIPVQLHLPLPSISLPLNELEAPMAYNLPAASRDVVITGPGSAISDGNDLPTVADAELAAIPWARIVWMVMAGGMAVYFVGNHIRYRRRYRFAVPCEDETVREWLRQNALRRRSVKIKVSADISTALTYGVFRPVILLPQATDWKDHRQVEYVLLHEMTHIRHFDTIWKWCLCAALCVHWFNPLVWVMFVLANRDLELICDESVLKAIGVSSRSEYALTLIGLAEQQIKITQFGMAFSKNAIEERILAMMKTKKVSWLATVLAVVLIVGVTTGFTAAGQAAADHSPEKVNDAQPNVAQVTGERTVISYADPRDGKTYYSWDNGVTWTPMTDEEFDAVSTPSDVEWWTAEEYAAWLEEEKEALRSMIGGRGWTPSTGWFTWDQQMVDETIALYEQTLKDIQNGMKTSKPTSDGDTMLMFGYDTDMQVTATDTQIALGSVEALESVSMDGTAVGEQQELTPELLAEYRAHGLTYDEEKKVFFWNGKLVRYFFDSYALENGVATLYSYVNEDGVVDVSTVRQATQNADGSTDPGGKLIRIEEASREEFDSRVVMTPQMAQETTVSGFVGTATGGYTVESGDTGPGFWEDFAKYAPFGVTFVKSGSFGNIYWNGELVHVLVDHAPDGKYQTVGSSDEGGINIQAVYDSNGRLVGVEPVKD